MKIKALTLWQPWATLMALGEKKIETRSWLTKYRGLLAIHAAKRKLGYNERELLGHAKMELGINIDKDLPFGEIVCIVNLSDCLRTRGKKGNDDFFHVYQGAKHEELFGDYSLGRFAWITEMVYAPSIELYGKRLPVTGHQGLWNWEVDGYIEPFIQRWLDERQTK